MIVEDYVENGPTQVKAPQISRSSAPSGPHAYCLKKSIISFLNQIAVLSQKKKKKVCACEGSKQTKSRNNKLFCLEEERVTAAAWDVFNECRRSRAGAVKILNQRGLGNLPWLLHKQDAPISLGQFSV